jgi:dTDP-glucose pyrophosphorylase
VKAIVLAAGKGTRLNRLSDRRPKAMVPVCGRPMLHWVLDRIARAGIHEFIIVTGYLADQVEAYFGKGEAWNWDINYVHQKEQNGTGAAVDLCRPAVGEKPFLLSYSDILAPRNHYPRLRDSFETNPCDALLTLQWVEDPYKGGALYVDSENRVERIVEKPPPGSSHTHWNNGGMYVLTPGIFEYTASLTPSPRGEYELTDALTAMIADGRLVRGLPLEGHRCDLTTPDDVARIEEVLRREKAQKLQ